MYSSMDSKLHYETKRFMAHLRPMWLLKSNLLFLGGWKEEGFSQLQKNATYMNFK